MNNTLSVVIPIYNEEEILPILRKRLQEYTRNCVQKCEFIFVNDGSTDRTEVLLSEWRKADSTIHIVNIGQNKGHQNAILAGLQAATGDFIVTMDADLQDPPELIQTLMNEIQKGFDVVHARRNRRYGESLFRKSSAWLYYRLMKHLFFSKMLLDVGDFRIMTKKTVDDFLAAFPNSRILRADLQNLSLKHSIIGYERQKRAAGSSKFTLCKLFSLATGFFIQKRSDH